MNRIIRHIAVLALAAALLATAGCASNDAATTLDPAARAVQSLLELRYERSTDASAYAEFLATPDLATELARASTEETTEAPPTPTWDPPYVSAETTSSADVVVVWGDRTGYEEWPPATVFSMQLLDDERWAAADARTLGETETVPAPLD